MTSYSSQLSSTFTDTQRKLRLWLEHVEQSINNDKLRLLDLNAINAKRRVYKDLFDQANEHEHNLESLRDQSRDFYTKLTVEQNRHLQDDLLDYQHRLNEVKIFLSNALTKCHRFEKTLTDFEVKQPNFSFRSSSTNNFFLFFSEVSKKFKFGSKRLKRN